MKVIYDAETDVLRILFREVPVHESDESSPGVILDYDHERRVVGIEVLDGSNQVTQPRLVELALAG